MLFWGGRQVYSLFDHRQGRGGTLPTEYYIRQLLRPAERHCGGILSFLPQASVGNMIQRVISGSITDLTGACPEGNERTPRIA
jgi:hypothetical protein